MLATTAACGVGGDDGGGPGTGSGSDDRNTKLGIICNATFKITGTFAPGTPTRPNDPDTGMPIDGCWPVGTWTFSATLDPATNECKTTPTALASYSFRVDRMEDGTNGLAETRTNLGDVSGLSTHISVSSNGQGCEGNFELGSPDGKDYWNMQPTLLNVPVGSPPSTTLSGTGDYSEYNNDAWPWK